MLRPKASTSGGQSEGRVGVDVAVAAGGCEEVVVLVLEFVLLVLDLAISNQELTEVQERQLRGVVLASWAEVETG